MPPALTSSIESLCERRRIAWEVLCESEIEYLGERGRGKVVMCTPCGAMRPHGAGEAGRAAVGPASREPHLLSLGELFQAFLRDLVECLDAEGARILHGDARRRPMVLGTGRG